jgi:hypothetical protein
MFFGYFIAKNYEILSFEGKPLKPCLARTAADDVGRPLKRIKLEQGEIATDRDLAELTNVYPDNYIFAQW